jgi:predicted acylesterase/phospholipase RssA
VGKDGSEFVNHAGPTAAVLSGGGAKGAYEVGVLKALLSGASPATDYRPIDPEIYTGTSVGGYNSTFMSASPELPASVVIGQLEQIWLNRIANTLWNCGNGVFRIRGAPCQGLDPGCILHPAETAVEFARDSLELTAWGLAKGAQFFASEGSLQNRVLSLFSLEAFISASPFVQLVDETINFQGLARSPKTLMIAASNWRSGILKLFDRREIAERVGRDAVLASAALPGLFPPVEIDGVPFVDGGLLQNSPLKPAIRAGAKTIHLVFLDPLVRNIPLRPLASSLDVFDRMFAIIWANQVRFDLRICTGINQTLAWLRRPQEKEPAPEIAAALVEQARKVIEQSAAGRSFRPINVHVYRPADDLGGGDGLIDFHERRLETSIRMGFDDAVNHDCRSAGCILAEETN